VAEVTRPRTILCHLLSFERLAQLFELSVCLWAISLLLGSATAPAVACLFVCERWMRDG